MYLSGNYPRVKAKRRYATTRRAPSLCTEDTVWKQRLVRVWQSSTHLLGTFTLEPEMIAGCFKPTHRTYVAYYYSIIANVLYK
jgi:TRAP-type C4-dicarboxylate transport system permease large subunit